MSGYTADDRSSESSEQVERGETIFELPSAERMLPLVRRIGDDVLDANRCLARILPELETLDRKRRQLPWPQRQRRYHLQEQVAHHEGRLEETLAELEVLGVVLLNPLEVRLGFPTVVNNRRAYFVWRPGERNLRQWQFAGENQLRTVPSSWIETAEVNVSGSH